jgi:lipid II:glycine glycyltransferase (peptidoglycan interpeptide bridge formation enzyme)
MHHKTRYNIRVAERRGVRVRLGTAADLSTFYTLLQETARRDGFLVRGQEYFRGMWRHCLDAGLGWMLLAEADGDCLAGAIVFQVGEMAWYLYGASTSRRRDLMPAYAVQWDAILRSLQAGCRIYDFRGVSGDLDPENPLYGLFRFKRGFGAELVELVGEWDRPYRPAAYWAAERALRVARRAMARLRRRGEAARVPDA